MAMVPYRAETGVYRFGEDWPGVWLRGRDALALVTVLRELDLDQHEALKPWIELLTSAEEPAATPISLRPYRDCVQRDEGQDG